LSAARLYFSEIVTSVTMESPFRENQTPERRSQSIWKRKEVLREEITR